MSNSASGARLVALTRELMNKWHQTRNHWRDAKAQEFEQRFMDELEHAANATSLGIENLERIIRKIKTDCE